MQKRTLSKVPIMITDKGNHTIGKSKNFSSIHEISCQQINTKITGNLQHSKTRVSFIVLT